ncbi:unnamed protein product [Cylicostephanus goldi]|uniref:Mediator of RNA polymerase II transcription subunit 22 n=1 Tax=Cylicostephanus goldi TaxID=71465 RepID=A0A3P7Q2D2_CYLGO|nr:unnamed protein product [Cylicostephanus goldi]
MSGVAGGGTKKSSSRSVATKTLIIQEYKRRLRDNIRSLNDNFINILNATKVRACDELLKLTNDLKEFLILHDFNFLTHAIKSAEEECDKKMKAQIQKHNALRLDVSNLLIDMDKEIMEHFTFRH